MEDQHLNRKVRCIGIEDKSISQLLSEMAGTAFQVGKLGEALEV